VAGSICAGCFSKRKKSEAVFLPQTKKRSDFFAAALRGEQEGFYVLFEAFFGGKHNSIPHLVSSFERIYDAFACSINAVAKQKRFRYAQYRQVFKQLLFDFFWNDNSR